MRVLVADLKERQKGKVSHLSRGVVYHSRFLIIEVIKESVILSLSGSLSLVVV